MEIKICQSIDEIDKQQWNALLRDNNPFCKHEFLHALEEHQCVDEKFGWIPRHIAIYKDQQLIGAMPLYEKHNSYGEFVFDQAWSDAYHRSGLRYFPKLVSCIPYTPIQGQRLLCLADQEEEIYSLLLKSAQQIAQQYHYSSFHVLFPTATEHQWLEKQTLVSRYDCQFHWFNHNYKNFDDFLSNFSSRKRKNIRKERNSVKQQGVTFRVLDGFSSSEQDWLDFTCFYEQTFAEKFGMATLNLEFFKSIANNLPEQIVLVLADYKGSCIAGSLMYKSDDTLYGRFWGCQQSIDNLHFEACYYQGIEYCIKHRLKKFEPGAQGEHKIARGFIPVLTKSSHFLTEPHFQASIEQFVKREQAGVIDYMQQLNKHLPYKKTD
ncbi:MAG: GNAT family N-acetyltransferase [Pseudomonadota bacterium]